MNHFVIGSGVILHSQDIEHYLAVYEPIHGELPVEDPLGSEFFGLRMAGRPRYDVGNYQVACTDGTVLIVKDFAWVACADEPVYDLLIFDNQGLEINYSRLNLGAFLEDSLCDACQKESDILSDSSPE